MKVHQAFYLKVNSKFLTFPDFNKQNYDFYDHDCKEAIQKLVMMKQE